MPTIALRVPIALPAQPVLPSGQTYILFPSGPIMVRTLIAEKVQAELRKARAGGLPATALPLLLPDGVTISARPVDETQHIAQAQQMFEAGRYLILCDGRPCVALDEVLRLRPDTALLFVYVPAAAQRRMA